MEDFFCLDLPFDLIQSIRLSHALMESKYKIHIPSSHSQKFILLKKKFGINYGTNEDLYFSSKEIMVSHEKPLTKIGSIERPLIFPHSIIEYCRSLWPYQKNIRFSFAGLLTESRRLIINNWSEQNFPEIKLKLYDSSSAKSNWLNTFSKMLNLHKPTGEKIYKCEEVIFWSSERGRTFPTKSWDEEYFKLLANSEFVLCPNGDYVWSYRFFEAIMCGAIPVIENYSSAYEGFYFKTLEEPVIEMKWSKKQAEYNFNLCRQHLTISMNELNTELDKIKNKYDLKLTE